MRVVRPEILRDHDTTEIFYQAGTSLEFQRRDIRFRRMAANASEGGAVGDERVGDERERRWRVAKRGEVGE